ncbi:pilus assembly protein [Devosia algicola]|uniref:Pilus assembly protein n=1 Tax=Devosia algicola TaxID=3026418 RepID=A0ABY7YL67_9HYPH|nr:TadE/TadG family type IV pilus assembly protein [Devosia algicola]WDR01996.1 pilus assembly protein [Devosia algicola]
MLHCRAFLSDCRAASAVEFAILAPVFMLMLTGMLAYSIYFGAAHSVQQIAADAARTSIAGLNARERDALVGAYINNNAADYLLIERARLTYSIGDKASDPNQYQVNVEYDASALPIWNLYPPLPLPSKTISFSSSIRRGGL